MSGPTVRDVAARAGTSTAVVSYVLNDGPRPVAAETRERVLRAVDELGYRRNEVARALRSRRTGTLGLLVPHLEKPFFAELTRAVEDIIFARGLRLLVASSHLDRDRERGQVEALLDARVDGLLLVPVGDPGATVRLLRSAGLRHVLVHRTRRGTASVAGDDHEAGRQAVRHLLEHGHRTIACLTGPVENAPVGRRTRGAQAELARAGHPIAPELLLRCDFSHLRRDAYRAARVLLADHPGVTAICATTDEHALGIMRAADESGRRIGSDLALVSIDGAEQAAYLTPPLTAVTMPFAQLAEQAVDLLAHPDGSELTAQRVCRMRLVRRRSCGCDPDPAGDGTIEGMSSGART